MLVGDGRSGKTALIRTFKEGQPRMGYTNPTIVFEKLSAYIEHKGARLKLEVYDTAGDHALRKILGVVYPDTDVVVICYSIGDPDTFANVSEAVMFHVYMFLSLLYRPSAFAGIYSAF